MRTPALTRTAAVPSTALCRCFCRYFVAVTGAGLAASAIAAQDSKKQELDND